MQSPTRSPRPRVRSVAFLTDTARPECAPKRCWLESHTVILTWAIWLGIVEAGKVLLPFCGCG